MNDYEYLPASVGTLYAELLQQVKSAEAVRSLGDLKGTFVSKKIKNKTYWYLQHSLSGHQKQVYLGPESTELLQAMKRSEKEKKEKADDLAQRKKLCAMLVKGGIPIPDAVSSRVLLSLAESGVFKMGTVLVGTHAFQAYSQLLSIVWKHPQKTQDIDIAQNQNLSVALASHHSQINLTDTLDRAKMGFFPIPPLNPKNPSTSFKMQGRELHLDLLTPLAGKESSKPVHLPSLGVAALPLRFLDYLIEEPAEAVIPYDAGILVKIPDPARFAFHKLIVANKRPVSQQAKVRKDLAQASVLLKILKQDRPSDLQTAWEDLKSRGKGWRQTIFKSLDILKKTEKDWVETIQKEFRES